LAEQLGAAPFFVQAVVRIDGVVDAQRLAAAIEEVAANNESLRTTISRMAGMKMPVQVIAVAPDIFVVVSDLADVSIARQQSQLDEWITQDRERPFHLETGPLIRVRIVSLGPQQTRLLLTASALVMDRAATEIFLRQVAAAYEMRCEQPKMQYADLAEWQNTLLEDDDSQAALEFWRRGERLADTALPLPYERAKKNREFAPQSVRVPLSTHLSAKIQSRFGAESNTCATVMLALWQILLFRMTSRGNFTLGLGCDGRNYDELASAVGLFARFLPMRCHVHRGQRLSELVDEIEKVSAELREYQEYFSWESAADPRHLPQANFDVCFDFDLQTAPLATPAGQRWSLEQRHACIEKFQLMLLGVQTDLALTAELQFDANVYCAEDIARLAEHFAALADAALESDLAIEMLPLLSEKQRREILIEWNNTDCEYPLGRRIEELIAAQAAAHPDHVAVIGPIGRLTYAELDCQANQLAHYMQKCGVGPDTLVGLCVERSPRMLVAILAILKAGGAYVPMDPSYPSERLAFMLADTAAAVIVTQADFVEQLGDVGVCVCIDRDWPAIEQENDSAPTNAATPENLAYIIYTSGSTGKPKGVEIRHRNLVHSTTARSGYYGSSPGTFILLSSFAFDSSIAGIFWTLSQGGTLLLPPQGAEKNVDEIADLIHEHRVTTLLGLPSLYAMLLDVAGPERLGTLCRVIVAGEACPPRLVASHRELLPAAALFNEYGPTEATVWSTVFRCDDGQLRQNVPIGKPIANTRIYILDEHRHPAPVAVAGEIFIGGQGIARGYLNRADLTAERFVASPFDAEPDARLYRTGDLARYLADGNIEFLGRTDHQVKIRGYRIELEEIEHVLTQHAEISEAVVAVHRVGDEISEHAVDNRIVAYVVAADSCSLRHEQLREHIASRLPEYMVPWKFVELPQLPLMPNGKIDRNALPDPALAARTTRDFVAPRNALEAVLAGIWREALAVDAVSVHDNFFELGGNSLLVTRLVGRLRELFRIELSLRSVFDASTVACLAEVMQENAASREALLEAAGLLWELSQLPDK
jgi:amino acid adenylation domain-containing protein